MESKARVQVREYKPREGRKHGGYKTAEAYKAYKAAYRLKKRLESAIDGMKYNRSTKLWGCIYPDGETASYIREEFAKESMKLGHKTSKTDDANVKKPAKTNEDLCPVSQTHFGRAW